MADFKIKPAAGTGNKLILESEDGTDVLTTSASGVTLASATLTAPTLTTPTITGDTTNNGNVTMATNKKVQQKGAFMQSSTHQALTLGG